MSMIKGFSIATLVVVVLACTVALFLRWSEPQVSSLPQYHGKSEQQIITRIGQPIREDQFGIPVQGQLDNFRGPLHNTYPPDRPANADVRIRELTWRDGAFYVTVWLHRVDGDWLVLDTCRWHEGVQF